MGIIRVIGYSGSDFGVYCEFCFSVDYFIGIILMINVNVEDNEVFWEQYILIRKIFDMVVVMIELEL